MSESEVTFLSEIDSEFSITILFPESKKYLLAHELFKIRGSSFLLCQQKNIIIDGDVIDEPWFNEQHMLALQARNISGYLIGDGIPQPSLRNFKNEKEVDWMTWFLLQESGFLGAATLCHDNFCEQYGSSPNLQNSIMKKKFDKCLNDYKSRANAQEPVL